MKTVTQYREDIKALMQKSADINAQATMANRELTSEEVSMKNALLDKVEELEGIVQAMERENNAATRLEAPVQRLTVPQGKQKFEIPVDSRSKDKFSSLGEQISAVVRAAAPGGSADPRLFNAASGLNETVPSDGGFLVQTDFATDLMQDVIKTGVVAPRCSSVTISGNANGTTLNGVDETSRASSRYGGVTSTWEGEADQLSASKPKFRQIELKLKKLTGFCYATEENLQDSSQLEGIIRTAFSGEFGFKIDDAIINGSGAGEPLGILNSGSLVSVAKETGQKAKTILAENVINMYSRIFPSSYGNAVWLINQDTLPQLLTMSVAVGTGGIPVYLPPGNTLANAPGGALMGLPVLPIEQAQTLGTVGDIILADLSGYKLARKGGIQADMSIHVRFEYAESVFRFLLRMDGQPVRSAPLTPFKGTNTLSHFVALATRA